MDRDLRRRVRPAVHLNPLTRGAIGVALTAAAVSPGGVSIADRSLTGHVVQHVLLLQIAPLLIVSGVPHAAISRLARGRVGRSVRFATRTGLTWLAGVGAMVMCSLPGMSGALMAHRALGETVLVSAGALFWLPIVMPRSHHGLPAAAAIAYLFTACLASTIAGISTAFAAPQLFGDRAVSRADQQFAGLVMWLPCCVVYLGAILATLARWYGGADDAGRGVARAET